jgi:hypothetical protein
MICGMMMYHKLKRNDMNQEIEAYRKHRNLRLAAKELNIPLDYYEDVFYKNKRLNDNEIGLDLKFLDNTLKLRK